MAQAMAPNLLTPSQVSELLTISEFTLRQWRKAGKGPPYVILGKNVPRYPEDALEQWIRDRTKGGTNDAAETTEAAG